MQLVKRFLNHKGVDLKSSDLLRPSDYAADMVNAQYSDGGAIEKRSGFQAYSQTAGGYGSFTYQRINPTTGLSAYEFLSVDQNLWKQTNATFTVTYGGANATAILSFFLSKTTLTYHLVLQEGDTTVLDFDCGIGFDETTPLTLANLKTAVDAVTGFSAAIVGATTTPAAFLQIIREVSLVGTPWVGKSSYWTQVYCPLSTPFSLHYAERFKDTFENQSTIQLNNVIYFSNGYSECYKYDGQTLYRAGLPTPAAITVTTAVGAITGSNYVHRIQYLQIDASGNFTEGNLNQSTAQNAAAQQFSIPVPNIQPSTGFNTNCAMAAGAQVGVTTINVDNGAGGAHTLQVGDTAYFFDGATSAYVTRTVTARTASTIVISGANVNIADNAPISNNLRILIWRSKSSAVTPTAFYLVDEIPNNSFAATTTYIDNKLDSALGELLLAPVTDRSVPPKGKYISQWNGQMFIGGILMDPTLLAWSDVESPEYFPNNTNQIFVEPGNGDIIAAIGPNNEVFTVHGNTSFTVISGDIGTGQIRVETRARDVGCTSHATLVDIDGVLAWLSPQGPRQSSGGSIPIPLGPAIDQSESNQASRIDPAFDNDGKAEEVKLRLKRAVAYNDTGSDKLWIYVPAETGNDSLRYPNSNSKIFVFDRVRDAWLIWNNINVAGGIAKINDEVFFVERRFSSFVGSVQNIMYRLHNLIDAYDYADNVSAIEFDYSPQWEFLGEPSVLKDPLNLRVFSLEQVANNQFTLTVQQEINFQNDSATATFTMAISGGGYGNSAYGDDPYGDPTQDGYIHPLGRNRIRAVRPRFRNSVLQEAVAITGWEIEFSTPYRPEFKK